MESPPKTATRARSAQFDTANKAYLRAAGDGARPQQVVFVLQEHFSMSSYAAAMDVLVTVNLVLGRGLFCCSTTAVGPGAVTSDLGVELKADAPIGEAASAVDVLVVCGGYRGSLEESRALSGYIRACQRGGAIVCGLWNGAVALAHAGILERREVALHPDNKAYLEEKYKLARVSSMPFAADGNVFTSAGISSAIEMTLAVTERVCGRVMMQSVRQILGFDHRPIALPSRVENYDILPKAVQVVIGLMESNIEDPLELEEVAQLVELSRRQLERLFKKHIGTTPLQYYLEVRLTYGRQLLIQSNATILEVAQAAGFATTSHFSNRFRDFYGVSPTEIRRRHR